MQKELTDRNTDGKNLIDVPMCVTNTWMRCMDAVEGQMDEINQQAEGLMNGI